MVMGSLKKFLSDEDRRAVADAITKAEQSTIGEIRVSILMRRTWNERKLSVEAIARKDFHRLGMEKTRQRSGILIMILFRERRFHILADEGIHRKVEEGTWDAIAGAMTTSFGEGHYREGICSAVDSVGSVLARYMPRTSGDVDELPNEVDIR